MCFEQIMAWFNTNGVGIYAITTIFTLAAIVVQVVFACKLWKVSNQQKEISKNDNRC